MTTLREAAQQALEALEALWQDGPGGFPTAWHSRATTAITALRAALEQPDTDYRAMYLKVRDELAALQQRKPLTNAEIEELMDLYDVTSIDFVRAIEAAHGIKESE